VEALSATSAWVKAPQREQALDTRLANSNQWAPTETSEAHP